MPYVSLYRGASCPRCGERLVHYGRVWTLFLRPPCLRCPACRFTAWREPRRPPTPKNAAQAQHRVEQRQALAIERVSRVRLLLRRAVALAIVAGTGALALPWIGLNQSLRAPEVRKANVATPIADPPRLDDEARIPESVVAAVKPVTFSIDPIPLPEIKVLPTRPSSKNLPGSKERASSLPTLDSRSDLKVGSSPAAQSPLANREYKIARVSIQIREEQQRARAIQIAKSLCTSGYTVAEIELVAKQRSYPSAGDIRYYYAEQNREAEQIAAVIGDAGVPLKARLLLGFDALSRNRIEIWLPVVGSGDEQPADRHFSCGPRDSAGMQAFR
jgi:hypothetical protein